MLSVLLGCPQGESWLYICITGLFESRIKKRHFWPQAQTDPTYGQSGNQKYGEY